MSDLERMLSPEAESGGGAVRPPAVVARQSILECGGIGAAAEWAMTWAHRPYFQDVLLEVCRTAIRVARYSDSLDRVARVIETGRATYESPFTGERFPCLASAVVQVAGRTGRYDLAIAVLGQLGVPVPPLEDPKVGRDPWIPLSSRMTSWTMKPHDEDATRLRRDDRDLIARWLRGEPVEVADVAPEVESASGQLGLGL